VDAVAQDWGASRLVGRSADGPVFCADAVADRLAGLQSALAVAESVARGGGELIDVAMAAVAASYAAEPEIPSESDCAAAAPAALTVGTPAVELGADTARVDRLVTERRYAAC
jgi:hypothetical protein